MGLLSERENPTPDEALDLRQERCPMTFLKIRLALEQMDAAEALRVLIGDPESIRNVPRSLEAAGCDVFDERRTAEGALEFRVQKNPFFNSW